MSDCQSATDPRARHHLSPGSTCCQLCGGALSIRYATVHDTGTGDPFSIAACGSCGLGQTQPVPTNWERYYPAAYHGGRHGATAAYCIRRRMSWVQQIAGKAQGRRLLDIGCGDGSFLLRARQQHKRFRLQSGTAPIVRKLLEISGIFDHLDCTSSREEAIR